MKIFFSVLKKGNAFIPGKLRLMVDENGDFFPCEKGETLKIGDVFNGFNYKKVLDLMEDFANIRDEICKDCWVIRFCHTCYIGGIKKGKIDKMTKIEECERIKRSYEIFLKRYIEIMEKNPNSFMRLRKWTDMEKTRYFLL